MSYPLSITITCDVSAEYVAAIADCAVDGVAYWALDLLVTHDVLPNGIHVVKSVNLTHYDGVCKMHVTRKLSPKSLAGAVERILAPGQTYCSDRVAGHARSLDPRDVDAELADVIVQVAAFDSVIYG